MKLRILLLPLLGISLSMSEPCSPLAQKGPPKPAPEDPIIEVTTTNPRYEKRPRLASGKGVYASSDTLIVKAQLKGVIEKVYINEGDRVSAGDSLCLYRSEENNTLISKKQSEIRETQLTLDTLKEALHQLPASEPQYMADNQEPTFLDEEAPSHVVPPKPAGVMNPDPITNRNDLVTKIASNEALIEKLTNELILLEEGLKDLTVKTGIGGVIRKREITDGSVVLEGESLFEIVSLDPITLVFSVPQDVSSYVDKHVSITAHPTSAPELSSQGSIFYISPSLNILEKTLEIKAHFPNPDFRIKEGQSGEALVTTRKMDEVWIVPKKTIVGYYGKNFVYVLVGNQARLSEITLGDPIGDTEQIVDANLRIDDMILNSNLDQLKDGTFVKIIPSEPALVEKK